jgi:non-heme chloroperoxidase
MSDITTICSNYRFFSAELSFFYGSVHNGQQDKESMTQKLQRARSFHVSPFMLVCAMAGLYVLTSSARNATAPGTATWSDPSPHRIAFVTVDNGVQLEVLDWGGMGRAVVLLAGYQTAHEYDDIAPKLSAFCHVYGITRRGFGASSRPHSGYTAQQSAEDVLQVLYALKLDHPVLSGHSFGGQDLLTIAAQHPALVAGLVFLDSGDDPTLPSSAYGVAEVDTKRLPASMTTPEPQSDNSSFQAFRESQLKAHGVMEPEAELRQRYPVNGDGSIGEDSTPKWVRDAIFAGIEKPKYANIHAPVLAILAAPLPLDEQFKKYQPTTRDERAAMEQKYAVGEPFTRRTVQDLKAGDPNAQIVILPGASTYVFLSNERDTVHLMQLFLAGLG